MTGSHGFVGSNLIESLDPNYEIIRYDARENKPLPECDVIIHLAGLAHDIKKSDGRWKKEDYFRVNTELTKNIYDRFLVSSAKKFIFFSSIKALDNDTPYAKSKKAAEDYILCHTDIADDTEKRWSRIGELENNSQSVIDNTEWSSQEKSVYILRPCMIHGKGNKGNLNLLVKWVKKGWPWPLAAFENKRSFASMDNVSFIVNELINRDIPSGIYDICDDEAVSTNELIELICKCMGKKAHLCRIPKGLMIVIAQVGDVLHLPLNTERLEKLTENYIISNEEIKLAMSVERLSVDAKEGLRQSIMSMINEDKQ